MLEFFQSLPKELAVFIMAATPVIEVRGAVPFGFYLGLPWQLNFSLNVVGSVIPVIPILWFLNTLTIKLRKIPWWDKFFTWLFARTRAKSKIIQEFELIGLILFIGIPFPGTGVWTGCIAAYLFGLRWLPTFICAILGTIIATTLMTLASLGIINFFT